MVYIHFRHSRCNKFPELNRYNEIEKLDLHRNTNTNNDCKRYKKLGNAPWVQILVHISTFLIGDFDDTIEYLGMRGLAKFQTFEQAVLKYRNSEYVAPKIAPNRAPRRASLSSTTRKTEYHRFLDSPRRRRWYNHEVATALYFGQINYEIPHKFVYQSRRTKNDYGHYRQINLFT